MLNRDTITDEKNQRGNAKINLLKITQENRR